MATLFWTLFVIDLLVGALALLGKGFREDFGASAINTWFTVLLFAGTIGALVFKLMGRQPWALAWAGVPLLVMLLWYIVDKRSGG